MALTPKQAWAIAHLITELRPEWQAEGVVSALKRCADKSPYLTALAAIRAAADPNAKTPGVIPTSGTHWDEGIKSQPRTSFNIPCPEHADQTLPCRRCAAARVSADNEAARLARANLSQALAQLCPHKVDRRKVRCGECELPTPDPAARSHRPDAQTAQIAEETDHA